MANSDTNVIIQIIKEVVKGRYAVVCRDASYYFKKIDREEIINFLRDTPQDNQKWEVENEGDLARLILSDNEDPTTSKSDVVTTFNAYKSNEGVRIAQISLVADSSIMELVFDGKQPNQVITEAQAEKK